MGIVGQERPQHHSIGTHSFLRSLHRVLGKRRYLQIVRKLMGLLNEKQLMENKLFESAAAHYFSGRAQKASKLLNKRPLPYRINPYELNNC